MAEQPLLQRTAHFLPLELSDQEVSRRVFGPMQHFLRLKAWRWLFGVGLALLMLYLIASGCGAITRLSTGASASSITSGGWA
jgi:hypothetical protein